MAVGDTNLTNLVLSGTLTIQDVSVVTALLLASGQAVDLNGESGGLIFDADANTKMYASADDVITINVGGAADFTIGANTFTALSGSTIATNTIAETTAASGVTIDGVLVKDNTLTAWRAAVSSKSANYTVTTADSGTVFVAGAADLVFTLPATASGLRYRFVLASAGLSTGTGLSISPAAADKIMGNGFTSADNKDAVLAGSGDREGDCIEVVGDGADGWYITSVIGTWTREG